MVKILSTRNDKKFSHTLDERDCPRINIRDFYTKKELQLIKEYLDKRKN